MIEPYYMQGSNPLGPTILDVLIVGFAKQKVRKQDINTTRTSSYTYGYTKQLISEILTSESKKKYLTVLLFIVEVEPVRGTSGYFKTMKGSRIVN
jgi:hypothetical protein